MESIDYQLFVGMCFVVIRSLERAKKMSWYRVSKSITVAMQREGKRRIVVYTETVSCS